MDDITKVRPLCMHIQKVLPCSFDDSLSTVEALAKVQYKINELIEYVDGIQGTYLELAKEYTDGKIADQTAFVNQAVSDIRALATELEEENQRFIDTVNARMVINENKINNFQDQLIADIKAVNNRTDLVVMQNNEYLLSNLEKELANVKVLNYFTGEYIGVQAMFDYLAQFHLENAITVNQLITRDKTVNQLIALDMTMTDLATNGGTIIQ